MNRLSMGAQASQASLLRLLGRIHDWERVVAAVELARQAGFDNFNLDLMFGLPSQTVPDVRETLTAALALSPTHLSCYGLIVEEGTPICRDIAVGRLALPDVDVDRDMYELVRQTLAEHDFHQYEISNFARPGYACRHNVGCWTARAVPGLRLRGAQLLPGMPHHEPVKARCVPGRRGSEDGADLKRRARFESMMLGLRMTRGVENEDFTRMHGMGIREAFAEKLDKPTSAGLLEWQADALRLTRLGMDLQNSVLVDLM